MASGPSASTVDLTAVKGKAKFIAINMSWELAPWSDILYGCDDGFWKKHAGVPQFKGLKVTQDAIAEARFPELKRVQCDKHTDNIIFDRPGIVAWGGNSGLQAINLAVQLGARKLILVGFDMRLDRGLHWHGKHPSGLNNPTDGNVARWRRATDSAAPSLRAHGVEVINVSPVSALTSYSKMSLEKAMRDVAVEPLRVLAVGNCPASVREITNFSGVYSFYIQRELAAQGVLLSRAPRPVDYGSLDLADVDHVIAFGLRQFEKDPQAASGLSSLCAGAVCQFSDGTLGEPACDLTFAFKGILKPKNVVIGWAADPKLTELRQSTEILRILIDHADYVKGRGDLSARIKADVDGFVAGSLWRKKFKAVEIVKIDSPKDCGTAKPFDEMCAEYVQAHIAIVTHPEAVGLWVIEAAMAGALIVSPSAYIPPDLLGTVRRIEYQRAIPWEIVLRKINPDRCRARASFQTWDRVASKIIAALRDFRK